MRKIYSVFYVSLLKLYHDKVFNTTPSVNAILYTDESKLEENLGAGLCYMYKDITHQQS